MTMLNIRTLAGHFTEALTRLGQVALEPQGLGLVTPVYSHLLITAEARAEECHIFAFNGRLRLTVPVACRVSDPGLAVVPAQRFAEYIRNLDKGAEVVVAADYSRDVDGRVTIKTGRMRTAMTSHPEAKAENWPALPGAVGSSWLRLPAGNLALLLERVRWCLSSDDARPALTGVYLVSQGQDVRAYGSDGYRLAHQMMPLNGGDHLPTDLAVVVPGDWARVAQEILARTNLLADDDQTPNLATVWTDGKAIALECAGTWLTAPLVEAAYPNLDALLAYQPKGTLDLLKQDLMNGLQAADVIARTDAYAYRHLVTMDFDSVSAHLRLEAESPEVGAARIDLPVEFDYSRMGYRTRADWLRQAVSIVPDEWHVEPTREGESGRPENRARVRLRFHAPTAPLVVSAQEIGYWAMVPPIPDSWLEKDAPKDKEAEQHAADQ